MKKLTAVVLAICLTFAFTVSAFAMNSSLEKTESIKVRLERLEEALEMNLESLEIQLEEQDMMEHFEIHKSLLMNDYESQKLVVLGEKEHSKLYIDIYEKDAKSNFTTSSINYVAPNGAQYDYNFENHGHRVIEEYYIQSQLSQIIDAYIPGFTLGGLNQLIVITIASFKIPQIGVMIAGYSIFDYLDKYLTTIALRNIKEYGYGFNRTVRGTYGNSTVWFKWETYPNVPRNSSATSHTFIWF